MRMIWFIGILIVSVAALLGLNVLYPDTLGNEDARMNLVYGVILLTLLASSASIASRIDIKQTLRAIIAWAAIFLGFITLYTYQDGFKLLGTEILSALDPSTPRTEQEANSVVIRASTGGHFIAVAQVEGKRIRFLVDTGATSVVLSPHDARRLGFRTKDLSFTTSVSTANGKTMHAQVRLKTFEIGTIKLRGVNAYVARDGLEQSLLGMNVLRRLSSYEFTRNKLVLKK